jgi:hypothetical protein
MAGQLLVDLGFEGDDFAVIDADQVAQRLHPAA